MKWIRAHYREVRGLLTESWSLGWPMILIMFFHFSIGIADVYVAGYLGTHVLAAVGYVGQLYWTLLIVANAITVGTVSMVSQAYGAGSSEGVGNITANSLVIAVAVSGVLTGIAEANPDSIVRLAGMPTEIMKIAEDFLRIYALVLIPTYLMIITGGVLRSSGRVRVAMLNSFLASVLNVVGDFALAFGWGPIPELGYRGIAWATAISTTVGMGLNLINMFYGPAKVRLRALTSPLSRCMRNLVKLGFPSALQQTAWNAGALVIYFLVSGLHAGEVTALAAMTAGLRIEAIIFLPIFAFNMACAVLTGNRLGTGDVEGARSVALATAGLCLSITLLPTLVIFIVAPWVSGLLTDDPAVIAEITRYLRINMIGTPFLAIGISLAGALQGGGDTYGTMRIIFVGMWAIRIPLILFVIHVLKTGAQGVWWCMAISMILMCALLAGRFRSGAWTTASIDKKDKSMLWEACTPPTPSPEALPTLEEEIRREQDR